MSGNQATEPGVRPESKAANGENCGTIIARLLVDEGQLTDQQLRHAQRILRKLEGSRSLVRILSELGFVGEEAVRRTLRTRQVRLPLGELLCELGYLSPHDLQVALALQREQPSTPLGELLCQHQFVSENDVFSILTDLLGVTRVFPETAALDPQLVRRVPTRVCRQHGFIPLHRDQQRVVVAFSDPMNQTHLETARKYCGQDLVIGLASRKSIEAAIARAERDATGTSGSLPTNDNTIVAAVNEIINDAIAAHASDIHVEPLRERLRIRFRQDGAMLHYKDVPQEMVSPLLSRIKVMAGADIAERRRHQDGRIHFDTNRGGVDIRVSFYVTIHGENVVLRLLNNRETLLGIKDIGLSPRTLEILQGDVLDAPSGVVIVTGPTGSGKTTTLYAAVNYLNDARTSIITAEDPVEYIIDGISQCSINPKISVSYEETLKHIVRQDPDVIVIGEIRDLFSAEVAINAALTGHKVLTTFHTEDSIGGLLRLMNMNIEAFLISSTVVSVVAQRLVRRVCDGCAEPHPLTPHELRRLGYAGTESITVRRSRGCQACRYVGYRGRVAVFELLVLNERVRDAIINRRTSYDIRSISLESSGLVTLLEDGIAKAAAGLTSFEEIVRHLPRLARPRPLPELNRLLGYK